MDETLEKRFADCCGAAPLDLMVERDEDGVVVARGTLNQPYALIGRDPYCDIHLNDPSVALRHACAQVIGGHLFVVDLASPTGTYWPTGRQSSGWLMPGEPLAIGPFRIFLTRSAASSPTVLGPDFQPLAAGTDGLPPVTLEFRSGRSDRRDWTVNRLLTLVGRASECKLHLSGEDIALFHAYFVKTVAGLWVVDLLARGGTRVNGKKVRLALLAEGDEVLLGKFALGVKYPPPGRNPAEDSSVSFDVTSLHTEPNESGSVAVKSSARIGPPPETMLAPESALPTDDLAPLTPAPADAAEMLATLRQMADMQAIMFEQFQQSLELLMKFMGQSPAAELPKLDMNQAAQHQHEVWQRMEKLNEERQGLWKRLIGKAQRS